MAYLRAIVALLALLAGGCTLEYRVADAAANQQSPDAAPMGATPDASLPGD